MESRRFIGRLSELDQLTRLYASPRPEFLILYGRRRIGKTRLLTHWLEKARPRALFWVAEPTSSADQLHSFSQAILRFQSPQAQPPPQMTYGDWRTAFEAIAQLAQRERLVVIIDEFTYLLESEPAVSATLQHAWDHVLSKANLMLVICGSHLGMMVRQALSYQAPLYGRATANLLLQPLPFGVTGDYFPQYTPSERVAVYAMLGGVPAYWERFTPAATLDENIHAQFLAFGSSLHDEPRLLLADFLSDSHNYISILRAIASGAATPKEIANLSGLDEKHIPQYLSNLHETGFIARRVPVTQPSTSRLGRQFITDPFMRFYYRFLSRRTTQLALGINQQAREELKRHLLDFIGTYTWEELCQEWLLRASDHGALPFVPDQVGAAWTKKAQVDVVGINRMEKTLVLGECKWSPRPVDQDVLADLIQKTGEFVPSEGAWRVFYLGFARGGWTKNALRYHQSLSGQLPHAENWTFAGMQLLDLEQVDRDLKDWSKERAPRSGAIKF